MQARRNMSYISSLATFDMMHQTSSQAMSRKTINFYSTIFLDDLSLVDIEENKILSYIHSIVIREMNDSLMQPICMSDLEEVVFNLCKGKASRPDSFPVEFFHEFWDIINHDLLDVVKNPIPTKICSGPWMLLS